MPEAAPAPVTEPASATPPPVGGGAPDPEPQTTTPAPVPTPTSAQPQTNPAARTFTQLELDKVRSDEKAKQYAKITKLNDAATATNTKLAELEQQNATLTQHMTEVRSGKTSEVDSLQQELGELRNKQQTLEESIKSAADTATKAIRISELKIYRDKQLATSGIAHFSDTVAGNSEEEIDASITTAKEREEKIVAEATAAARKELGVDVPSPVAPGGGTAPTHSLATPQNRKKIASLGEEDYQKRRAEMMQEAKNKMGR